MSVRVCAIDYLIKMGCMYGCALLYLYIYVKFNVSVYYHADYCKEARLSCSVLDMCLSKCFIVLMWLGVRMMMSPWGCTVDITDLCCRMGAVSSVFSMAMSVRVCCCFLYSSSVFNRMASLWCV